MGYQLIECDNISELEKRVNRFKAIGWHPCGGPFAVRPTMSGPIKFYQAIDDDTAVPTGGWQVGVKVEKDGSRKKWTRREKKVGNGQTP